MASRRAAFLAARERTHGKETMASRCAEFIAAGGHTVTWVDFQAAMAEWAVDLEVAKAAQNERKRQKAIKKRESCRRSAFLAARDRTHGKEAMASRHAEFIAVGGQTVTWAYFEAAMAE